MTDTDRESLELHRKHGGKIELALKVPLDSVEDLSLAEPERFAGEQPFACKTDARRHPKETKGDDYNATTEAASCRTGGDGSSCC